MRCMIGMAGMRGMVTQQSESPRDSVLIRIAIISRISTGARAHRTRNTIISFLSTMKCQCAPMMNMCSPTLSSRLVVFAIFCFSLILFSVQAITTAWNEQKAKGHRLRIISTRTQRRFVVFDSVCRRCHGLRTSEVSLKKDRLQESATCTSSAAVLRRLRGGDGAPVDLVTAPLAEGAYSWCVNLGAPSALVAGGVIGTIYENVHSGDLELLSTDKFLVRMGKKITKFLLFTAFALEALSIFVTTVTGTMLLSRASDSLAATTKATTPLAFLREQFEYEYLTARITFLQGLLNWLAAVAITHLLPDPDGEETVAAIKFNRFIASSLITVLVMMLSFYNGHMNFYENYGDMLSRWFRVFAERFLLRWPPRPMAFVFVPSILLSLYWGYQAFTC